MRPAVRQPFGTTPSGEPVELIRLFGDDGMEVSIITFGAAIQSLIVPDRDGELADVVLGHDSLDGYLTSRNFFGAIVGRYANRIAGGRFPLAGTEHRLETNDGPNALHGGHAGPLCWRAVHRTARRTGLERPGTIR